MEVFMKFINKLSMMCASIAMMASTMSYAGTVVTSVLDDNYIGAFADNTSNSDYMPTNNSNYDTHWMQVSRDLDNGTLSVQVNSNFVGYRSIYKLGDLFLMDANNYTAASDCNDWRAGADAFGCSENSYTAGTNKWEYAFDLGLDLNDNSKNSKSNYNNKTGQLRQLDTRGDVTDSRSAYHQGVNTASQLKGGRSWQIVDAKSSNQSVGGGTWNTDVTAKLLTMTFDISNTALMTTDQIALRWAMSCANDIIEVVTNFKTSKPGNSTSVPEPSTILLMLLAGFGFYSSRKKQGFGIKK